MTLRFAIALLALRATAAHAEQPAPDSEANASAAAALIDELCACTDMSCVAKVGEKLGEAPPSDPALATKAMACVERLLAADSVSMPTDPSETADKPDPSATPDNPSPPPAPLPAAAKSNTPLQVSYDKGILLKAESGHFSAKIGLRNQFRVESTRPLEDGSEFATRLYIPRARLQLEGFAYSEANRYKLEFALGDRGSFGFVRDLFVERSLKSLTKANVWVRVGQWKRPFNRQELVSDFASAFNERAITADFVGGGRDMGIAIHNEYDKSPNGLEWIVGVFNGFSGGSDRPPIVTSCADDGGDIACSTPAPTTVPGDFAPAIVARAGWNSGSIKGYSEGDLEGGGLRYALGVSYKVDLAGWKQGTEASLADNMSHGVGVDAMVKVRGFDVQLGAFMMKIKSADAQFAGMAQLGYLLCGTGTRGHQAALRFAFIPTNDDRKLLEMRLTHNWLLSSHAWKWSTDMGALLLTGEDGAGETDKPDLQVRSMLQMTF